MHPRTALIQQVDGIEMPAPGDWRVLPGQGLALIRSARFRSTRSRIRTVAGCLSVGSTPSVTSLVISARTADDPLLTWRFAGRLVDADRLGRWSFRGSSELGNCEESLETCIECGYQGVFSRGAWPVAWISFRQRSRSARACIDVVGELNIAAPADVGPLSTDSVTSACGRISSR